jgi:parvulin-like peptidyl-prolyl isomerase
VDRSGQCLRGRGRPVLPRQHHRLHGSRRRARAPHPGRLGQAKPAAADKARAKTKADGLANQARAQGADFGLLARENSDEPVSKARGGDLGPQARGALEAAFGRAFEEAAFKTKVGEVSAPIESPFGFHVLKVDEKFTPRTLPLTEVRQLILDQMLPVKREEAVAEKMTALRKAAKITKTP